MPEPLPATTRLAIIGAGPAGLAASIQAARIGLEFLLFERERPGGWLATAAMVENYPGFPRGIPGVRLAGRMLRHAERLGVRARALCVESLALERGGFRLQVSAGSCLARAVLLAPGCRARQLGCPGEAELAGRTLFYRGDRLLEAGEPGRVLVAGGGDAAFDQASLLAAAGARVALVTRGERPRALGRVWKRALGAGIGVHYHCQVLRLVERGEEVEVELSGPPGRLTVDRVLVAVGKQPDLALVPASGFGPGGALRVDPWGRTSVSGLFLAGDARRGRDRQTAIAVGDGMAALLEAERFLGESEENP